MYKGKFFVPSVEFQDDITYFSNVIVEAGGEILKEYWDGEEEGDAVIFYQCKKEDRKRIEEALENA